MSFWDPYNRYGREHRRRMEEQQRKAELEAARRAAAQEAARRQQGIPQEVLTRFQEELAQARRERDEWEDRYNGAMELLEEERQALVAERERLQDEIEAQREQVRAEADTQRERLLRNAEQRAFEENRDMLRRMLAVVDDLERALAQEGGEESPLAEGVQLTYRNFQRALEQAGVEKLETVGAPFDPNLHEAVGSRESGGADEMVLDEVSPGYLYRGTLLRPARVIVSR